MNPSFVSFFGVLIETLWNVNHHLSWYSIDSVCRINRNIVECKLEQFCCIPEHTDRINRNIVECKCLNEKLGDLAETVLIETLWNVN